MRSQTIYVVEDDETMRTAVDAVLQSVGYIVRTFGNAADFLNEIPAKPSGCLVLDVRLPGSSGLELQRRLKEDFVNLPIIFTTGHGDIPMSVQAMKGGAIDFLVKPFRDQDLLDAVCEALKRDRANRDEVEASEDMLQAYQSLSRRERQVMELVVTGKMNKQIAADVGLSEVTVKVHRAQVMRKMGVTSLAALVRVAAKLQDLPRPLYALS